MSKASEWAKVQSKEPPSFSIQLSNMDWPVAEVDRSGRLSLSSRYLLEQKSALALADWIYDTFGEEADAEEPKTPNGALYEQQNER